MNAKGTFQTWHHLFVPNDIVKGASPHSEKYGVFLCNFKEMSHVLIPHYLYFPKEKHAWNNNSKLSVKDKMA